MNTNDAKFYMDESIEFNKISLIELNVENNNLSTGVDAILVKLEGFNTNEHLVEGARGSNTKYLSMVSNVRNSDFNYFKNLDTPNYINFEETHRERHLRVKLVDKTGTPLGMGTTICNLTFLFN